MKKQRAMISSIARILLAILGLVSCKKDEPIQPHVSTIQLTVEDVSCTEAWLKVSLTDAGEPRTVAIQQDGHRISVAELIALDSILVVEGLQPQHTYSFVALRLRDSTLIDESAIVQMKTMDTTSHDFTWEIDTLGVASSTLYGVSIVSNNSAWVVGEMYFNDSIGRLDPILYNAAHWDGTRWELKRITWQGYPSPIRFVFAYSENDVWFGMGYLIHWNGATFTEVVVPPFYGVASIKMWGSPSGHLYVVGNNGVIAYSPDHGSAWQGIESGTTLPIRDIYGTWNDETEEYEVLCVADADGAIGGNKLLSIVNGSAYEVSTDGLLSGSLWGIWFVPNRKYIAVGDGLWQVHSLNQTWQRATDLPALFKTSITGQGLNDIAVCGAYWLLAHWNGATWRNYFPFASGSFTAVAMSGNRIIAVGGIGGKAIVVRGTR